MVALALAACLAASPDAGAADAGSPSKVEQVLASMTDREKVAQLIIAYPQIDKTGPVEVGGVLFVGNSLRDIKKAKAKIQSAKDRARIPPFVAADIEGGDFNRLKKHPLIANLPFGQEMGALTDKEVLEWGFATGKAMREIGLNMNLAPVLDVAPSGHMFDNRRAFSGDPDVVVARTTAFSKGLWKAGVVPIGKHYPGYGDLAGDSDHALVTADWPIARLNQQIDVFNRVGPALGGVMMANAIYPALGDRPAILNPVLVSFAHERDWITVTDDISIGVLADAVQGDGADVLRAAFMAGNDLLLTTAPPDWDKGIDYVGVLLELSREKPEYAAKVDAACRRILTLKERLGLLEAVKAPTRDGATPATP